MTAWWPCSPANNREAASGKQNEAVEATRGTRKHRRKGEDQMERRSDVAGK